MRALRFRPGFSVVLACSALCLGCEGDISGAPAGASGPGGPGAGGSAASGGAPMVAPAGTQLGEGTGLMPLRRLNRVEYANTIATLFGSGVSSSVELPNDPIGSSSYQLPTVVGGVERDRFEQAAEEIAGKVASQLATLAPCEAGKDERTCADGFVRGFGKRVFRRPVLEAEVTDLLALYDALRSEPIAYGYAEAVSTLLGAMLQSPQFLYHWQLGPNVPIADAGLLRLGGYEVASRLSYFLWASMPDAELFAAAESGSLDAPAGVSAQARRMLATADAKRLVLGMVGQWIAIDKLPALVKDQSVLTLTEELKTAMRGEFETFTVDTLLTRGSYRELLTSNASFVSAPLAQLYGVSGDASAGQATPLPDGRVGLFSQAAFLSLEALPQEGSPVRRGKMVANRLLCRTIAAPPPGLNVTPPEVPAGLTTREAYSEHSSNATCAGCHEQMDPLGFAFEHFDAVGRYRTIEAGKSIDTTGMVKGLDGVDVSFDGVAGLMTAIADSAEGQRCFVTQLAQYALSRALGDFDAAGIEEAFGAFKAGSLDVRELVPVLAASRSFRYRVPAAGEVIQ